MAGSWLHMTSRSGRLLGNERFCQMIENLGDAYEAAEQCYGMAWYLASLVIQQQGRAPERQAILEVIEDATRNHKAGLKLGGVSGR